jgi:hypothetical protein
MPERGKGSPLDMVTWRVRRMNALLNGLVVGFICGLGLFVMTIWLVIKGGPVVGPHLNLLGQYFYGYGVSGIGSLIGFFYGFALGFIVTYGISILYNWLAGLRTGNQGR